MTFSSQSRRTAGAQSVRTDARIVFTRDAAPFPRREPFDARNMALRIGADRRQPRLRVMDESGSWVS
jgi:hypothetical protein